MFRPFIFALLCFAFAGIAADANPKPIGFVVEHPDADEVDDAAPAVVLTVIRDGVAVQLREGDAVYPGDVLSTDASTTISVAFVDRSAVRLFPTTELRLDPSPFATGILGGTIVSGHASVGFQTAVKTSGELSFGAGARSIQARAASPGSAKLDIVVHKDDKNNFLAIVGVVSGSATLQMVTGIALAGTNSQTGVEVKTGATLALTLLTPVKGVTGPDAVTVTQGNLSKDQLKALKATAVAEYLVSTGKGVSITAIIRGTDGTVTTVKETLVNGVITKDSSQTKDPLSKKTIASWSESSTKISFKKTYEGFSLAASMTKTGVPGKGTMKGPDKTSYKGSTSYDPKTGRVTFTSLTAKDGSVVIYSYDPRGNRGTEEILIKADTNGKATQFTTSFDRLNGEQIKTVQTGTLVFGKFVPDGLPVKPVKVIFAPNPPNPITPDGHSVDQNSPPPIVSQ